MLPVLQVKKMVREESRMKDPRGPSRVIVAIEERSDATILTLDCGHTSICNQIFHYEIGAPSGCLKCNDQERAA